MSGWRLFVVAVGGAEMLVVGETVEVEAKRLIVFGAVAVLAVGDLAARRAVVFWLRASTV